MAETITGELEVEVNTDNVYLHTNNNSDTLTVSGLSLTADQVASLAWLMNGEETVVVSVKEV